MTHIAIKSFTFKDEIIFCKTHNQTISYYCICKEKLCATCLTEGIHFIFHPDFKIMPIKELKRIYINEIEEVESFFYDLNDHTKENISRIDDLNLTLKEESKSHLLHFYKNYNLFTEKISQKFFEKIFFNENKLVNEMAKYLQNLKYFQETDKIINSDKIVEIINKCSYLKEKAKIALVSKIEKINGLQNVFIRKNEEFIQEYEKFLEKFFSNSISYIKDDTVLIAPTKNEKFIEKSLNNIVIKENFKSIESKKYIEKENYEINTSKIEADMNNLLKSNDSNLKIICDSINLNSASLWKDEIITKFKEDNSLSYEKEYCLHANFSIEKEKNISLFNDSNISYGDKKSICTDIYPNNNFNRINKIIRKNVSDRGMLDKKNYLNLNDRQSNFLKKNKNFGCVNHNQDFVSHPNAHSNTHSHLQSQSQYHHPQYVTYNNFYNNPTPSSGYPINQTEADESSSKIKFARENSYQSCIECTNLVQNSKFELNHRKIRCNLCQKNNQIKIQNTNNSKGSFYIYNSYKAGKMNQICNSCNTTFIVPVALSKQRKTCYYCFKAGKVPINS